MKWPVTVDDFATRAKRDKAHFVRRTLQMRRAFLKHDRTEEQMARASTPTGSSPFTTGDEPVTSGKFEGLLRDG